jgi:hypothetical protein
MLIAADVHNGDMVRLVEGWYAGCGERFAQGCLDAQLGKRVPVTYEGVMVLGTVVAVEVAADGSWAEVAVETEIPVQKLPVARTGTFTIGRLLSQEEGNRRFMVKSVPPAINPWVPLEPGGLPPRTYPMWRRQEAARLGITP